MRLKSTFLTTSFIVGVGLSGCVSVLPDPPPPATLYRLGISSAEGVQTISNPVTVNIELPDSTKPLSGIGIVVSQDGRRLTTIAQANWAEPVPRMLRAALVDQLETDPNIVGVIPKGSTLTDYRLNMNIRRFEAIFDHGEDAPPECVVQVNLTLTETKSRSLVATKTLRLEKRAEARNVSAIVETLDGLSEDMEVEIVDWLGSKVNSGRS